MAPESSILLGAAPAPRSPTNAVAAAPLAVAAAAAAALLLAAAYAWPGLHTTTLSLRPPVRASRTQSAAIAAAPASHWTRSVARAPRPALQAAAPEPPATTPPPLPRPALAPWAALLGAAAALLALPLAVLRGRPTPAVAAAAASPAAGVASVSLPAEPPAAQLVRPMVQWLQGWAAENAGGDAARHAITSDRPLKVVIAGGGVGGLMAARYMQLKGMDVTVLERTSEFKRFGGPIQLASNALATIKAIDENLFNKVMGKFTFTGTRTNGIIDGKRDTWYCKFWPITYCAEAFDLPYTGVINRPDLQELCLEEIKKHKPDCIRNGVAVKGYEMKPDHQGVTVLLEDGSTMDADVLVGADGIWSNVRAQMYNEQAKGPGSGTTYSGYTVFAGETVLKTKDYFDIGYKVYIGERRYFVVSDVGEGRIQWYAFLCLPPDSKVAPEERRAYLRNLFEGWSQDIHAVLDATADVDFEQRDLYDRPPEFLRSWSQGDVTMLGDAVHPMMPNLGQGGCQAMEDAYVLTNVLTAATDRRQIPRLLQEYYWKRIIRVSVVQGLSRLASDLIISTFTTPWSLMDDVQPPTYFSVMTSLWRPVLPVVFLMQFGYLYSYHPTTMEGRLPALVRQVSERHRHLAEAAWRRKEEGARLVRPPQFT